jgi:hypothetical protein
VDPKALISRTFSLRQAAKALAYAQKRGVLKVLLKANQLALICLSG